AAGVRRVVQGVGGSACTDGGAGVLVGLGARVRDADGRDVGPGGGGLAGAASVDLAGLDPRWRDVEVVLAADVDNPLTGPEGAAAVYGPQKGATPEQVAALDAALARWGALVDPASVAQPGAGAAGGVGFAALAVLGATRRPGIDVVLELVGFADALADADVVVTGEGSVDAQTLRGKAPAGVAAAARAAGVPVVLVCGRCEVGPDALAAAGVVAVHPLSDLEPDPARSQARVVELCEQVGAALGAGWA
ncbi:glycerate kinase, partial [Rhodococcus aerolatus]